VFFFRLCSILFFDGYLPYDRSGDWFYQAVELVALALTCTLIYLVLVPFRETYVVWAGRWWVVVGHPRHPVCVCACACACACDASCCLVVLLSSWRVVWPRYDKSHDRFGLPNGPLPQELGVLYIVGPALLLAMVRRRIVVVVVAAAWGLGFACLWPASWV